LLNVEPGCERFGARVPKDSSKRVFLYEIYGDDAALGERLKAQHFLDFNRACARLIKDKKIVEYNLENDTLQRPRR